MNQPLLWLQGKLRRIGWLRLILLALVALAFFLIGARWGEDFFRVLHGMPPTTRPASSAPVIAPADPPPAGPATQPATASAPSSQPL